MADKVAGIVDKIKELSLLEASELKKALEDEFGVSAAAPVMVAGAAAGGGSRRADCRGGPVHRQIAAGRGAVIGSVANAGQSERQYRLAHQFDHRRDAFLQGHDVAHP